ncbi:cysteine desulfurase [Halobacillus karajensis]|uniref:cysteine desulfurase n=1 Tax=Halobacillus karajensis TaxID=195088 RepID=A0A024P7W1_9BACI|nr:cysteine desulfurase family protein [Halobacillus karajensis]CDQ18096.1 Cysteine desulfurase [Halobacillus karajensis]CDQ24447.1 Cysteine desulfurase [Halobacillus karajensis]CDQ29305.1 Cysteine desulfurase [Halobacillus karajensis]SEH59371.1 cysteine desulfurase [Halobacillus karajensis]
MKSIYLDHAATSPVHPNVIAEMMPVYKEVFGNPSSVHQFGRKARRILDEGRRRIAYGIGANEKEIVFTSGGTEADNLAIIGTARANISKGKHIITTTIEHHATLHAVEYLESQGFEVTYLPVNENGRIHVTDVKDALREDTILVSIMMVNNETGVMQPINEVAELLQGHQAYFHSDIVQAYGLMDINVTSLGVDLMAVSSHKINGPKGIGFLYIREGTILESLQYGGEQERKRRAGTENIPAVKGLQTAVEIIEAERSTYKEKYLHYKELFLQKLKEEEVPFEVNGSEESTIESIVNISFPGMNVETLLTNFDLSGIAASSGSACTAGSVEPSHVLSAMFGSEHPKTTNSVRFSFGFANNEEDIVEAATRVSQVIKRLT